jgi:methyl-accepting chemotaxis protein
VTWFQNLTIRSKVMTAFAAVLIVTAVLGIFSINRLSIVNDGAVQISDNYLTSTTAMSEISSGALLYRQQQAAHIVVSTPAEKAKRTETMA